MSHSQGPHQSVHEIDAGLSLSFSLSLSIVDMQARMDLQYHALDRYIYSIASPVGSTWGPNAHDNSIYPITYLASYLVI